MKLLFIIRKIYPLNCIPAINNQKRKDSNIEGPICKKLIKNEGPDNELWYLILLSRRLLGDNSSLFNNSPKKLYKKLKENKDAESINHLYFQDNILHN